MCPEWATRVFYDMGQGTSSAGHTRTLVLQPQSYLSKKNDNKNKNRNKNKNKNATRVLVGRYEHPGSKSVISLAT